MNPVSEETLDDGTRHVTYDDGSEAWYDPEPAELEQESQPPDTTPG